MSDAEALFEELARAATRSGAPVLEVVDAVLKHQKAGQNLRVRAIGSHMATLVNLRGKALHILALGNDPGDLGRAIDHLVSTNPRDGSEVIVYGGGEREAAIIEEAVPRMLMHPFVAFHRSATGDIRSFPSKSSKAFSPEALENIRRLDREEVEQLQQTIAEHTEYFRRQVKERSRFFRATDARPVIATYALLAVISLMFFLQLHWLPRQGATEAYVLALGALDGTRVFAGEWFRLISVAFLHNGFIHFGMNSFVLYILGRQLEQTLGTARFIVVYAGSMIVAGLASAWSGGLSVGASGAIWGLLGAQAALAYRVPPVLPESIAERMKPIVKTNLLINVGISFAPFIDAAAHFGGGIGGAVIVASGVLYRKSEGGAERTPRGTPRGVAVTAGCLVLLMLLGLATALMQGQPWRFSVR